MTNEYRKGSILFSIIKYLVQLKSFLGSINETNVNRNEDIDSKIADFMAVSISN